jgi:hypothetical protein
MPYEVIDTPEERAVILGPREMAPGVPPISLIESTINSSSCISLHLVWLLGSLLLGGLGHVH